MKNKSVKQEFKEYTEDLISFVEETDKKINCANVEWNFSCTPIELIKDKIEIEYIPYCLAKKEIVSNVNKCKSCKLRKNK